MKPPPPRYDLQPRRANLAALILICIASGAALAAHAARRLAWGATTTVMPRRVEAATEKIDPNTACPASLRRLPGIGLTLAERIVEVRSASDAPAFRTADDLWKVPRIGPATAARIAPHLSIPPTPPTALAE